jgi:hypothetical protein
MTERIVTAVLILWVAISGHAQGIFRLNSQLQPTGLETNLWKSNSTAIAEAIGLPERVHTNDVPWLFVLTPGLFLGTDENGYWQAYELPGWWPDPSQGTVTLDGTNDFTGPVTFSQPVTFGSAVDFENDLNVSNLIAESLVITDPIDGAIIGPGVDASSLTTGVLDDARIPLTAARTNEAHIGLLSTDQLTLGGVSRTTWPDGAEGSGDSYLTITTTNATPFPLWTNSPATNVAEFVIADIIGEGPTNSAAFRLSAATRDRDGVRTSWTNTLESFQSAGSPSAFWGSDSGAAVLQVAGVENEHINWKAVLKQLSIIGGEPTPSGFDYLVNDGFETSTLGTNWTVTSGITNNYIASDTTDPLVGSGSLKMVAPTTSTSGSHIIIEWSLPGGQAEAWATFIYRMDPVEQPKSDTEIFRIGNAFLTHRTTGNLRLTHGSAVTSRTSQDFWPGNYYRIWVYYRQSTGSDGILRVWRGNANENGSDRSELSIRTDLTNGTSGSSAYRVRLSAFKSTSGSVAVQHWFDDLKVAHQEFLTIP